MIKITHLISCEIPKSGFERLYFFVEKDGKFFWGDDKSSIGPIDIERWMKDGSVIKLARPIQIDEKESLFVGVEDGPAIYSWSSAEEKKLIGKVKDLCP